MNLDGFLASVIFAVALLALVYVNAWYWHRRRTMTRDQREADQQQLRLPGDW